MNREKQILFLLAAFGFIIRCVALDHAPPALNSDELLKAYDGASVYRTGMDHHGFSWPLFFKQSGEYSPPLYIYFAGLFSAPFGVNAYTTRLPSAVLGTLSIIITFLCVRSIFDPKTGLIAAALVTVSPWNFHYSRIGWEAISLIPLQLLGLHYFFYWIKTKRLFHIVLCGLCLGLTVYSYPTSKLFTPLLLLALMILYWRDGIRYLKQTVVAGGVFIGVWFPFIVVFILHYQDMQARWNFVSIVNNRPDWPVMFLQHYAMHLSPWFLFITGNPFTQHEPRSGLALLGLLPFFYFGIITIIKNKNKPGWFVLAWFLLFSIPSSLTYDRYNPTSMPSSLRSIDGMPVIEIISAVGLAAMLEWFKNNVYRCAIGMGVAIALSINSLFFFYHYFIEFPVQSAKAYQYGLREAVEYLESHKSDIDRIVISHNALLHPVALAVYTQRPPSPFQASDFPKYILPFYHYTPVYRDFGTLEYERNRPISRWYTSISGHYLILTVPGEIDIGQPVHRVMYPDGTTAYEIFDNRIR